MAKYIEGLLIVRKPSKSSQSTFGKLGALVKDPSPPTSEDLEKLANELLFSKRPGRQPDQEYPPLSPRQLERRKGSEDLLGEDASRVTRYPTRNGLHAIQDA